MKKFTLLLLTILFLLLGCVPAAPPSDQGVITPTELAPTLEIEEATATAAPEDLPFAAEYNLGETTITQSMFPENDRFHNMPVRLNGVIAVPAGKDGPYPVVLILHGNHAGCPVPEGDMVDRWPCDPEVEQRNYAGFEYLVQALAAEGYVALSININAENTFGFGEPVPFERLEQLVDLHLSALADAARGETNNFGVDLEGRVDLSKMVFMGHSQGGEGAYWLIHMMGLDKPDAFANVGYGPVLGLIMIAPSANFAGSEVIELPLSVILPSCDMDVFTQGGQMYYEFARLNSQHGAWASSVWLEYANHNFFNQILDDDGFMRKGRPDCEPILDPETQQGFLRDYAVTFLKTIFSDEPGTKEILGMDMQSMAMDEMFGLSTRQAVLAPESDRLPILIPASEMELETSLVGGSVIAKDVFTFYCVEGYYTPFVKPGSEPCKRVNLVIPANPAMIVISWAQQEAQLRFTLPRDFDVSQYAAISLRAALDPMSDLNLGGASQAFTIQLLDNQGNMFGIQTQEDEPALRFPAGYVEEDMVFEDGLFTGRVPLISIRIPLSGFEDVNLAQLSEIVLLFDQTASGSLFVSDIEFVR
jgi:hypothetical protein